MINNPYPKDKVAAAINKHLTEFRVKNWLEGSEAKDDAVTLADLEACGYKVVKA